MKKKEVSLWEMEKAVNSGEYYTSLRYAGQSVVDKATVALPKATSSNEVDDGIIYWETDYNLFCRAYKVDPNTGNYAGSAVISQIKQPVALSTATVALSTATKLEIKELAKTLPHKEVAKKYGVSRQYVSKLASTNA